MGQLFVLVGPSGVGKSTVLDAILREDTSLVRPLGVTTRPRRPSDVPGEYLFVSPSDFAYMEHAGALFAVATVYGHRYGMGCPSLAAAFGSGRDAITILDTQGADEMREVFPGDCVVTIFLDATLPTIAARLRARGDIRLYDRINAAREELLRARDYDHSVDAELPLGDIVDEVRHILAASRLREASV